MNEAQIMKAVERLHEQIATLPLDITTLVDEIFPDFDEPDCGPDVFLELLEVEIDRVEQELMAQGTGQSEPLQRLRAMLIECATAMHHAGV